MISVDDQLSPDVGGATAISAQLTFGGTVEQAVFYNPAGYTQGQTVRFAQQIDAAAFPTGSYAWSMVISELFPNGQPSITRTYTGTWNLRNLDQTPFGPGWMPQTIDQLYAQPAGENGQTGGVALADGSGNLFWFTQNADGSFTRPSGEPGFSTLVANADGSFTLTAADHSQEQFSSTGLGPSSSDATGNQTLYSYNTDHSIAQIAAPGDMITTFAYVNYAAQIKGARFAQVK